MEYQESGRRWVQNSPPRDPDYRKLWASWDPTVVAEAPAQVQWPWASLGSYQRPRDQGLWAEPPSAVPSGVPQTPAGADGPPALRPLERLACHLWNSGQKDWKVTAALWVCCPESKGKLEAPSLVSSSGPGWLGRAVDSDSASWLSQANHLMPQTWVCPALPRGLV